MEDRHEPAVVPFKPLAAEFGDAGLAEEGLGGDVTGEEEDFGVDEADDFEEIWFIVFDLLVVGFA